MIKINRLEIENVKRVKAVKMEPAASGLTVIGGKNKQGKSSVLDAIAWVLGGNKYRPSQAEREGSAIPPHLRLTLSNGLIVERKGKNSDLKVIDPNGQKAGQQLLDSFVEELAIDLPKFLNSTSKEKANTLLRIIGVGNKLVELETKELEVFNRRHAIGQIADQKAKFAKEQPYFTDAPKELISASDMIRQQQDILARNGENQRKRQHAAQIESQLAHQAKEVERLTDLLNEASRKYDLLESDLKIARTDALDLLDGSTAELETNIQQIDEINRMVRANLDKDKAETDASEYRQQYDAMTTEVNAIRQAKTDLLTNADLPLPGLSVDQGELLYNGQRWDNMSGAEQLRVATAIVRRLKPNCGFILLDKLEQMDLETLQEFGEWLEQEGLQAIATRVSTGDECSILIEDGYVVGESEPVESTVTTATEPRTWKAGEF
ncbi:AAA domain-containing protein [Paenibacillaceae bacterium GAS479]|nr:AAA domain-containing protein [Paenibacillaceae bacterium GAS479]